MKKVNNIYYKYISFDNLNCIWNVVRKTCKNKAGIFSFSLNKNTNIYNIYMVLKNKKYKPLPFRLFLIFEPKERLVMSQCISDKIVNHFVVKYYLLPYLERKLIDSNVATRKGKGSDYANKLIVRYINSLRLKSKNIYALKVDISKYFYSIDHNILIKKLEKDVDDENVINIIKVIIDETNKPYINKVIDKFNKRYNTSIPLYKKDVGLSIGAMTSQFLAIYYLSDLDHYIKEKLKCKYYLRYMDDFLILDTDIDRLKFVYREIRKEIEKLNLKVNPKSRIYNLNNGIDFLGYRYFSFDKFKIKYRKSTYKRIKRKLENLYSHDLFNYYRSYGSYYGYLSKIKDVKRDFKMKMIDKYNYYKGKHSKQLVFLKEGSFYKTFDNDALIVWNIFDYKLNNNSVGFGTKTKVFDELSKKDLGYFVVEDKEISIKGNDEIYDLYERLSILKYEKSVKGEKIHSLLEQIICKDGNAFDDLFDYLSKYLENMDK